MGLEIAFLCCLAEEFLRSSNLARKKRGTLGCDAQAANALPVLGLVPLGLPVPHSLRGPRCPPRPQGELWQCPVPRVDQGFLHLLLDLCPGFPSGERNAVAGGCPAGWARHGP